MGEAHPVHQAGLFDWGGLSQMSRSSRRGEMPYFGIARGIHGWLAERYRTRWELNISARAESIAQVNIRVIAVPFGRMDI